MELTGWSLVYSVLRVAIAIVVLLHVFLYFGQDRMLFFPQPLDDEMRVLVRKAVPDAQEIELPTADGEHLRGWFVPNGARVPGPALIYYGGNAEEVSHLALDAQELPGVSLFLVNYRGYGQSTGTPGEQAFFSDSLAIYDYVASRPTTDPKRIVAMGRSLGSGVAVYVASQRPVEKLVLVTPYDSVKAVAQTHYPFVFMGPFFRHPFDAATRAGTIEAPMLALVAEHDTIIPPKHAEALAKAWKGPVTYKILAGADHNSIGMHPLYWPSIRAFLNSGSG